MWNLEKCEGIPLYRQIMNLILNKINQQDLLPGDQLPSERLLAKYLSVNRSTVVRSLEELVSMGILIRKQGSGTFVNEDKWGIYPWKKNNWKRYEQKNRFQIQSPYLKKIDEQLKSSNLEVLDGYTGELPLDLIPSITLSKMDWSDFLLEEQKQDELGYQPLKKNILKFLKDYRSIDLQESELMITSGVQQSLFLLLQVLLDVEDRVAIELPSSMYSLSLFQALGIRIYGVEVDEFGLIPEKLEQLFLRMPIKMLIMNPTFQNPTGTVLARPRYEKIIQLCRKYQVLIIEDDVFGQLPFSREINSLTLKSIAPDQVVYIGSLSKLLGPSIKIGWLSAPRLILEKLALARKEMDFSVSIFPQILANEALNDSLFDEQLALLSKKLYERCQEFLLDFQRAGLDRWFTYIQPQGGYYIWIIARDTSLPIYEFFQGLLAQHILVAPAPIFGLNQLSFRINFARLDRKQQQDLLYGIRKYCLHYFSETI